MVEEYVAAGQLRQAILPVLSWYLPAPQEVQELDAAAEYMPTTQLTHVDETAAAMTIDAVPALQLEHALAATADWYLPASQVVHVTEATAAE
jgi:hypothetical protein